MPDYTIDVVIVEDHNKLAELHTEFVRRIPGFNPVGVAYNLEEAYQLIQTLQPKLVLLDNYLPDGQGIEVLEFILNNKIDCYCIFITAAMDINICSQAIRCGAFSYLIKPISYNRLKYCLERFQLFIKRQSNVVTINQRKVDELFKLQQDDFVESTSPTKGIEDITLEKIQQLFIDKDTSLTVDEVAQTLSIGKTTARRYLEYCLQINLVEVNLEYGKIGRPERKYRLLTQ